VDFRFKIVDCRFIINQSTAKEISCGSGFPAAILRLQRFDQIALRLEPCALCLIIVN